MATGGLIPRAVTHDRMPSASGGPSITMASGRSSSSARRRLRTTRTVMPNAEDRDSHSARFLARVPQVHSRVAR